MFSLGITFEKQTKKKNWCFKVSNKLDVKV